MHSCMHSCRVPIQKIESGTLDQDFSFASEACAIRDETIYWETKFGKMKIKPEKHRVHKRQIKLVRSVNFEVVILNIRT